ncbi:MAG: penicillin-binding transpeptidase domain-containing protein [Bacteroidota bacterium]|nr:penicillin-binding transpeptidase domain-containing protein [Bacteroidota bacterium]
MLLTPQHLVGSVDFFDTVNSGNVNGAIALRQPGSAIKPFIYALAFETGATPSDLIADVKTVIPLKGGSYIPENYDRKYHGLVSLRTALACSYNIPAVITAEKVGVELILQKLREAGFSSLNKSSDYYGLGLTLGNGEITLLELTQAYSIFAKEGMLKNYKILKKVVGNRNNFENLVENFSRARKVFSEEASYLITDILSVKSTISLCGKNRDNQRLSRQLDSRLYYRVLCGCVGGQFQRSADEVCFGG